MTENLNKLFLSGLTDSGVDLPNKMDNGARYRIDKTVNYLYKKYGKKDSKRRTQYRYPRKK